MHKSLKSCSLFLFMLLSLFMFSCQDETVSSLDDELNALLLEHSPNKSLAYFRLPQANEFQKIPQDSNNPLTAEKVKLGQMLYHETAIGTAPKDPRFKGLYSCASCHHVAAGFQAGTFQGVGEGGTGFGIKGEGRRPVENVADNDVQPIRSPSTLNVAYQEVMLWNGQFGAKGINLGTEAGWTKDTPKEVNYMGFEGVETQAIAGMGVHRLDMTPEIINTTAYKEMFDKAFPQVPEADRYSRKNSGLAMAAYERTLLPNKSPWQLYLKGNTYAMGDQLKKGAILFFGKANCVSCHTGPALNSLQFNALGMADLFECPEPTLKTNSTNVENLGRGGFTQREEDMFKFKVPQLYNLRDSKFYGHGASFRSVKEVIEYKNKALPQKAGLNPEKLDLRFKPKNLTEDEITLLTDFVENALYDAQLNRYVPTSLPTGACFPNADEETRNAIGCK